MVVLESERQGVNKEITNIFFGSPKGLVIDNSYDQFVSCRTIEYYKENKIEYLHSQDNELDYLKHFSDVKFLSIPDEAENFDELNKLNNLRGLSLYTNSLKYIEKNILEKIEYLEIIYDEKTEVDFSKFKSLKHLRISHLPYPEIKITNALTSLELEFCKKISTLNFLRDISELKRIKLNYLPELEDISGLTNLSQSLETVTVWDCKKIKNAEAVLSSLINTRSVEIITLETDSKMKIKSLSFMKYLVNLESFATNYKIEDGDLTNLLRLKDANITEFYENYNLKDKDLPHINVTVNDSGNIKKVRLDSLELGKEDKRIIWLR